MVKIDSAQVYNLAETVKMLKCHVMTVRKMIDQNNIKYFKLGRVFRFQGQAIQDFIDNQGFLNP